MLTNFVQNMMILIDRKIQKNKILPNATFWIKNDIKSDKLIKAAKGSILGAFIGDSAGAVLEFMPSQIKERDVNEALRFNGGGALNVEPGQITDDSEMAIALMRGIINCDKVDKLQQSIATEYLKWAYSDPFDIGIATAKAMQWIDNHFKKYPNKDNMDLLLNKIDEINSSSQSNGWLMRATPLAVYCHKLNNEEIYKNTKLDVNLTHTNQTVLYSVIWYNIAIAHLLNNFDDYKGAIERVDQYISDKVEKVKWDSFKKL